MIGSRSLEEAKKTKDKKRKPRKPFPFIGVRENVAEECALIPNMKRHIEEIVALQEEAAGTTNYNKVDYYLAVAKGNQKLATYFAETRKKGFVAGAVGLPGVGTGLITNPKTSPVVGTVFGFEAPKILVSFTSQLPTEQLHGIIGDMDSDWAKSVYTKHGPATSRNEFDLPGITIRRGDDAYNWALPRHLRLLKDLNEDGYGLFIPSIYEKEGKKYIGCAVITPEGKQGFFATNVLSNVAYLDLLDELQDPNSFVNRTAGYQLNLKSEAQPFTDKTIEVEINHDEDGYNFRVQNTFGEVVEELIPWSELLPYIEPPITDEEFLAKKDQLLPIILQITSRRGHTNTDEDIDEYFDLILGRLSQIKEAVYEEIDETGFFIRYELAKFNTPFTDATMKEGVIYPSVYQGADGKSYIAYSVKSFEGKITKNFHSSVLAPNPLPATDEQWNKVKDSLKIAIYEVMKHINNQHCLDDLRPRSKGTSIEKMKIKMRKRDQQVREAPHEVTQFRTAVKGQKRNDLKHKRYAHHIHDAANPVTLDPTALPPEKKEEKVEYQAPKNELKEGEYARWSLKGVLGIGQPAFLDCISKNPESKLDFSDLKVIIGSDAINTKLSVANLVHSASDQAALVRQHNHFVPFVANNHHLGQGTYTVLPKENLRFIHGLRIVLSILSDEQLGKSLYHADRKIKHKDRYQLVTDPAYVKVAAECLTANTFRRAIRFNEIECIEFILTYLPEKEVKKFGQREIFQLEKKVARENAKQYENILQGLNELAALCVNASEAPLKSIALNLIEKFSQNKQYEVDAHELLNKYKDIPRFKDVIFRLQRAMAISDSARDSFMLLQKFKPTEEEKNVTDVDAENKKILERLDNLLTEVQDPDNASRAKQLMGQIVNTLYKMPVELLFLDFSENSLSGLTDDRVNKIKKLFLDRECFDWLAALDKRTGNWGGYRYLDRDLAAQDGMLVALQSREYYLDVESDLESKSDSDKTMIELTAIDQNRRCYRYCVGGDKNKTGIIHWKDLLPFVAPQYYAGISAVQDQLLLEILKFTSKAEHTENTLIIKNPCANLKPEHEKYFKFPDQFLADRKKYDVLEKVAGYKDYNPNCAGLGYALVKLALDTDKPKDKPNDWNWQLIKFLIEEYDICDFTWKIDGRNLLHCAIEADQVDMVKLLIKKKVDVDALTGDGKLPWELANELNRVGIKAALDGAYAKQTIGQKLVLLEDWDGIEKLAAENCNAAGLGSAVLKHALNNNETRLNNLFNKGVRDFQYRYATDENIGCYPQHCAIKNKNGKMLRRMLELGANPNAKYLNYKTPFQLLLQLQKDNPTDWAVYEAMKVDLRRYGGIEPTQEKQKVQTVVKEASVRQVQDSAGNSLPSISIPDEQPVAPGGPGFSPVGSPGRSGIFGASSVSQSNSSQPAQRGSVRTASDVIAIRALHSRFGGIR